MKILAILERNPGGEYAAARALLHALEDNDCQIELEELSPLQTTGLFSYFGWILFSVFRSAKLAAHYKERRDVYTTTYVAALGILLLRPFTHQKLSFHYHGSRIPAPAGRDWPALRKLTQSVKHTVVMQLHRIVFSKTDLLIVPSAKILEQLHTEFPTLTDRVALIPNGVDTQFFQPISNAERQSLRKQYRIPNGSFVCLVVSRVNAEKGLIESVELVRAIQRFSRHRVLAVFAVPSQGNDSQYLHQFLTHLRSSEVPHLIFEDHQQLNHLYQLSNCVLSCSRREVFPLVLLEAAACGTPYFAEPNGAIEYYLQQIDPQLVLPQSQQAAARRVLEETHQNKLSEKLRAFAVSHTWQASAVRLMQKLEQLTVR